MYKLKINGVIRKSDWASIPNDENNRDWQIYQEWLADGNIPQPEVTDDEQIQLDSDRAKDDLLALDKLSIRGIREFLVAKYGQDAAIPQTLVNAEQSAIAARTKIIKTPK